AGWIGLHGSLILLEYSAFSVSWALELSGSWAYKPSKIPDLRQRGKERPSCFPWDMRALLPLARAYQTHRPLSLRRAKPRAAASTTWYAVALCRLYGARAQEQHRTLCLTGRGCGQRSVRSSFVSAYAPGSLLPVLLSIAPRHRGLLQLRQLHWWRPRSPHASSPFPVQQHAGRRLQVPVTLPCPAPSSSCRTRSIECAPGRRRRGRT